MYFCTADDFFVMKEVLRFNSAKYILQVKNVFERIVVTSSNLGDYAMQNRSEDDH